MKNTTLFLAGLFSLLIILSVGKSYSTVWTINVQNFSFTPDIIPNVNIGDTIRWVWVSGNHTTTSSYFPEGAATWDAPINIEFPFFDYIPAVVGTYNYVCSPHASMGMDGSFTVLSAQGITHNESLAGIMVAPNPFDEEIAVRFASGSGSEIRQLTITDLEGKIIYNSEPGLMESDKSTTVKLTGLSRGSYILMVADRTNRVYSKKILKK